MIIVEYIVKINEFEGPLDLLLHLIETKEMNILDINLSAITTDYITCLQTMHEHDIEVTSDFTEMAFSLLEIKTKMMLPSEKEDAKNELVQRLMAHREYKKVSEKFREMKEIEEKHFKRQRQEKIKKTRQASVNDILKIYQRVLQSKRDLHGQKSKLDELNEETLRYKFSVDGQIDFLKKELANKGIDVYEMLMDMAWKEEVVETYGAILELSKQQYISIYLEGTTFFIERRVGDE